MKFDWNDITIVPAELSDIDSREEIKPIYYQHGIDMLPLFTAPMDTVIGADNVDQFYKHGLNICLPRGTKYDGLYKDDVFYSFGLDEIIQMMNDGANLPKKVLIDIANGHMKKLYDIAKRIKEQTEVELMIGNIANPETYRKYCEIGVDWIRVGIGGGCFTPNSIVVTGDGTKKIKDISIGDKVITHKNRLREVTQIHTFNKSETLIRVNGIECTKNHEFYVILKSDRKFINNENIEKYAFWVKSSKLDKDFHLLIKF